MSNLLIIEKLSTVVLLKFCEKPRKTRKKLNQTHFIVIKLGTI